MRKLLSLLIVGFCAVHVHASGLPVTDIDILTTYLTNTWYLEDAKLSDVRVLPPEVAVSAIEGISSEAEISGERLARMKSMLLDGLAFVCRYEAVLGRPLRYRSKEKARAETFPSGSRASGLNFYEKTFENDIGYDGAPEPRRCYGLGILRSGTDGSVLGVWSDRMNETDVPGDLPFPLRRLETVIDRRCKGDGVSVIADVEDVMFDSLAGLNTVHGGITRRSIPSHEPYAVYRVELVVRKVLEGELPYDRISLLLEDRESRWIWSCAPLFRGMTVKVNLCNKDGRLCVSDYTCVLPYPPYEWAMRGYPGRMALSPALGGNPRSIAKPEGAVADSMVLYGDHTLARFYTTANDITGSFGTYPDYARTCRIEVWTASEGSDSEYWKNAWFANWFDNTRGGGPRVTVHNAEDGMDEETRFAFAWYAVELERDGLSDIDTFGAFIDRLKKATICRHCGKPHYTITVDPALCGRRFRFPVGDDSSSPVRAREALDIVCGLVGAAWERKGTEIVIRDEFSEKDASDMTLAGRLRLLVRYGLADVKGAEYVGVESCYLHSKYNGENLIDVPRAFSDYCGVYSLTGNGWRRKGADGTVRYLVHDTAWWDAGDRRLFASCTEKTRIRRDVAIVRAYLNDAADYAEAKETEKADIRKRGREGLNSVRRGGIRYNSVLESGSVQSAVFALAFACHLHQCGYTGEAESIYAALKRRPGFPEAAFAGLKERIRKCRSEYPTADDWERLVKKQEER